MIQNSRISIASLLTCNCGGGGCGDGGC